MYNGSIHMYIYAHLQIHVYLYVHNFIVQMYHYIQFRYLYVYNCAAVYSTCIILLVTLTLFVPYPRTGIETLVCINLETCT